LAAQESVQYAIVTTQSLAFLVAKNMPKNRGLFLLDLSLKSSMIEAPNSFNMLGRSLGENTSS
jgi:hypothetical protein